MNNNAIEGKSFPPSSVPWSSTQSIENPNDPEAT